MKNKDVQVVEELLKNNGYRLTKGRISLLVFLKNAKKPLTTKEIQVGLFPKLDKVTLYRALEDFVKSKVVHKINLQDSVSYYEFLDEHKHHHHILCDTCGKIEDIDMCNEMTFQKEALLSSKYFSVINAHSLEFFGTCKSCSKK